MRQQLTLLQRAVIERLRAAHYDGLADTAKDCWQHGERCTFPLTPSEPALLADYERANSQIVAAEDGSA